MSWRRGKAYAQDLRERVLAAVDDGLAVAKIAALFKVRPQRCHLDRALAAYHDGIRAEIAGRPDVTLDELRAWLLATHGVSASLGGMWNTLNRLGLTLKKRRATLRSRSVPTSPPPATPGASGSRP